MLMTLVYWGHYAGEAEMEPAVHARPRSRPEDLDQHHHRTRAKQGDHSAVVLRLRRQAVLVPADRKVAEAIAALSLCQSVSCRKQDKRPASTTMLKQHEPPSWRTRTPMS